MSFHVVINNWSHRNNIEARAFYELVMERFPNGKGFVDHAVYSPTQNFRCLYSSKIGSDRVKRMLTGIDYDEDVFIDFEPPDNRGNDDPLLADMMWLEQSLVGNCSYFDRALPEFVPPAKKVYTSTFEHDISENECASINALIKEKFGTAFTVDKVAGTLIQLKRHHPSFCDTCGRTHKNENPYISLAENGTVFFNCRCNPKSIPLGQILMGKVTSAAMIPDSTEEVTTV